MATLEFPRAKFGNGSGKKLRNAEVLVAPRDFFLTVRSLGQTYEEKSQS